MQGDAELAVMVHHHRLRAPRESITIRLQRALRHACYERAGGRRGIVLLAAPVHHLECGEFL